MHERPGVHVPQHTDVLGDLLAVDDDGVLVRTRRGDAAGRAHLKGGTLRGVNALAGYVLDRHGKRWIVVMTINHDNAHCTLEKACAVCIRPPSAISPPR